MKCLDGGGGNQILDWVIKDSLNKERRACADEWLFFLLLRAFVFLRGGSGVFGLCL